MPLIIPLIIGGLIMTRLFALKMSILLVFSCSVQKVYSYWYIPQGKGRALQLDRDWRGKLVYYWDNADGSKSYSHQPFDKEGKQSQSVDLVSLIRRAQGHLKEFRKK